MKMNKKLLLFGVPILLAGFVFAAVLIANLNVTATVSEAIETTQTELTVSAYPGGITCQAIEVNNAADWNLWGDFTFVESSNPEGVVYTVDLPRTETLIPGINSVNVCFDITSDSPNGTLTGTVTINRVSEPVA